MCKKNLGATILLAAMMFLTGCVTSTIRHPDGRVENRFEVLSGTSIGYGISRGPVGYNYRNGVNYPLPGNYGDYSITPNGGYVNHRGAAMDTDNYRSW